MKNFIISRFLVFSIFMILISSCATTKKTIKEPDWTKNKVKIEGNYLIAVGYSNDFGNRSWQMAEMDAHRKMAKVINFYIEGYRQSYQKSLKNFDGDKDASIRIIDKTHITSKAILADLEIVKDENKHELMWENKATKEYYIKVRLNLNNANKKIENIIKKELPEKTQEESIEELKKRSKAAHKRLSEKLKNMNWK